MKRTIAKTLLSLRDRLIRGVDSKLDKSLIITGKNLARSMGTSSNIYSLSDAGFRVYSQFDEDGIIEFLVQKVPVSSHRFIEFGVENYLESNTRFLLKNRNWKGLVMDSSPDYIRYIQNDEIYWRHDLTALCKYITPDNINPTLKEAGFSGAVGILSIDAGGMDYWIWNRLDVIIPDIVICEYNAVFGDVYPLVVPYQEGFVSRNAHYSGLYWGASAKALEQLAIQKGYVLMGSNMGGNNLFFIREALSSYVDGLISDKSSRPSLYRDARSPEGRLTYLGGIQRFDAIRDMKVINIDTGGQVTLGSLWPVYGDKWLELLT